jgi:hypothetical protein
MAGFSPTLRLASLGLLLLARETSADASRTGWTEVRTAHVTVKTDLSPKSARGAALLAEESRAALLAGGWPGTTPLKDRIELVVFSDHQDFEGYFGDFVRDKVLLGDYPPVVFLYGAPEAWEKRRHRPQATSSELGIIRVHGERLTDLQRLLRKCRHLFVFQGQPVLIKLAVTLPHEREGS